VGAARTNQGLAMIANEKKEIGTEPLPFEIVWRNPLALVQAGLRGKEANNPHYGWAEQARKIRARRVS
jgi:hypothetical protein